MDEILLLLVKKGAHRTPIRISTGGIGQWLGMSQQNASRRTILLEKKGKIKRGSDGTAVTDEGLNEIRDSYLEIKEALDEKANDLAFEGTVVDGFGEGEYYVRKYAKKLQDKLGYRPYPGTLNIKLDGKNIEKRKALRGLEPEIIGDFEGGGRKFGGLFLYKCSVNGMDGAVIIPMRTHHGTDVLEIVSRKNMRARLGNKKVRVLVRQ